MSQTEIKTIAPKVDRPFLAASRSTVAEDPKQKKLMLGALSLLLLTLVVLLWRERDFWFPDSPDADLDQPAETVPAVKGAAQPSSSAKIASVAKPKHQAAAAQAKTPAPAPPTAPAATTATRTVLPPLEVEVVAGDNHRTIRPGSSSVRVDLQPGAAPQSINEPSVVETPTAANVTSNASEHVEMSTDAAQVVSHPVRPNYPLLARQMKVQGSVILQALIGKDGIIQNLQVVSGPHILASAAQDAVRQWHFKPHIQGNEAVETQAKITVNFTISTN
ncbi:MAG TPA: energy transducer TonB [Candidatus Acidoferrum sp.]|nr:energy transducer TonB [Candidatus Acidoferrum sp.]